MKKIITHMATILMTVLTLAIMTALPVSAFAADDNTAIVVSEEYEDNDATETIILMENDGSAPIIQPLDSGSTTADAAYESTMDFILTWIRRIGAAVALFGAIILALALKKDDADQKENGIKTMVAVFVVWAITGAVDMFDLFT